METTASGASTRRCEDIGCGWLLLAGAGAGFAAVARAPSYIATGSGSVRI